MTPLPLSAVVAASMDVAATRSRTAKVARIAEVLRAAAVDSPRTALLVTAFLSGQVPQGRLGVGWRSLSELPAAASESTLTVADVDVAFTTLAEASGAGSRGVRRDTLDGLFSRATEDERQLLGGLVAGEVRQGALEGVVLQGLAVAAGVPEAEVRRAAMLAGRTFAVAAEALLGGAEALAEVTLQVGRPVAPMLAGSAPSVREAYEGSAGPRSVERKLDGIRVQGHKSGETVRVFTRGLDDITAQVPEVAESLAALSVRDAVLDGEAIALLPDGRPQPFQVTGARTASSKDPATLRVQVPLSTFWFDVLLVDDQVLLDEPLSARRTVLDRLVPAGERVLALVTDDPAAATDFFESQVAAGHEGVVVKQVDAPYSAGRRGSGWTKVKPRHTLDLVVLAVERGSGRRVGTLSNIHLGARDPETGGFVMLGKTFKGMTDAMLAWQTERFTELAVDAGEWVVTVRPEQVVEIAFDGLQRSSRYPGGLALRFARVLRYRDDKTADEADTIDTVRALAGLD
ncbi:MAG TPA: ATP-dependent DNA ligase [Propionibacteriaceae bacterium]|nr:ATP-dependent DNA ligase [Propionibacteriaceae bacterium]